MPPKRRLRRPRTDRDNYKLSYFCAFIFCLSFIYILWPSNKPAKHELRLKDQGLTELPGYVTEMTDLTLLDISGNRLTSLPDNFTKLQNLEILFCSGNLFKTYPVVLNQLPNLFMVSFKNNQLENIPEEAFEGPHVNIHWLILTGNKLSFLPRSVGNLYKMKKFMLANNRLTSLPLEMKSMKNLELIRLANNLFTVFPELLQEFPNLTWVALADNPFNKHADDLPEDLRISPTQISDFETEALGSGASGIVKKKKLEINHGTRGGKTLKSSVDVAVKYFKKDQNSDGTSRNEILITLEASADSPAGMMKCYGFLDEVGDKIALVFEFLENFHSLGEPPSFESCSRDVYEDGTSLSLPQFKNILEMTGRTLDRLHDIDIIHGDFYAHNILVNADMSEVRLSDFGAAWKAQIEHAQIAKIWDTRAFRKLVDDLMSFVTKTSKQEVKLKELIGSEDMDLKRILSTLKTI